MPCDRAARLTFATPYKKTMAATVRSKIAVELQEHDGCGERDTLKDRPLRESGVEHALQGVPREERRYFAAPRSSSS